MEKQYTVKGISTTMIIGSDGKVVECYQVDFETKSGIISKVIIPVADFSKEVAKQRIEAVVVELEGTLEL